MQEIRNFCIIAHIDHGKSTLADRLLEITGTIEKRQMREQLLDRMDLEREKGITIKLQPARMQYEGYTLNLIDTPGHVDFSYEVSRSLQACEGALLVVDATQGIQAQTLANVHLALESNLKIIPIINKIDLPAAETERVISKISTFLGCNKEDVLKISAKTGEGIKKVLDSIIKKIPPPKGNIQSPLKALIFDSFFDDYRGVVLYVRIFDGTIKKNTKIFMMSTNKNGLALEVGYLVPDLKPTVNLNNGDIGYIVTNLKSTSEAQVGDTVTYSGNKAVTALSGYKKVKPFVYAGVFPGSNEQYQTLKNAINKLKLNDSALVYEPENSPILGYGFRVGFLGLLHMEVVQQRLEREYGLELIVTNPSTDYQVVLNDNKIIDIKSADELPETSKIKHIKEPWVKGEIICPKSSVGSVIQLVNQSRGLSGEISYIESELAIINFTAPLSNLLTKFYDRLKSITSGYGSFNYQIDKYSAEQLVRLDFYIAGEKVDTLSLIVHKTEVEIVARDIVKKLKLVIPKQLFKVSIQGAVGTRFIAREDVPMLKKDVTGHLYGGDVSRKKKLWAKQKRGKTRLKKFGKVDIPSEAFQIMLKGDG